MDALKKAEQEKKEAAERLNEVQKKPQSQNLDDSTLTQELSTEKRLVDSVQCTVEPESPPTVEILDKSDDKSKASLSLSPIENVEDDDSSSSDSLLPSSSSAESELSIVEDDTLSTIDNNNIALKTDGVTKSESLANSNRTSIHPNFQADEVSTIPTEDTVQATKVDESKTLSGIVDDYEYFSATVSAVQLAQDIGNDSPTPVAAQTVFTASYSKPGNQYLQWGVFISLCLVIAVSLSFFIFNYTVPIERVIKSPLVAKDIETQSEPMPSIDIPESVPSPELDSNLFLDEITDILEKEKGNIAYSELEKSETENELKIGDEKFVTTGEEIWEPHERNSSGDNTLQMRNQTATVLPEKIVLEPQWIKITSSKSIDRNSTLINGAYYEYLAGNYDTAEKNYRNILKDIPGNRDALLGIAAISIRKGHMQEAYTNYLEVLRLYPGDSVAETALINFKHNGDYARNESILKKFLQREPDNSFLYYSLGRLYAVQKWWPEAQQSFFNAYRIENSNPDYAYNLAVSLDHIGQQQSAIDYYNVALKLADQTVVDITSSFDRAVVTSRINVLSNSIDLP